MPRELKTLTPIFLFSLPRAGSTLVQRILGSHDDIVTISEPWVLLPYLYALKEGGIYTEYDHRSAKAALTDFCEEFPKGKDDYFEELREFTLSLYTKAARGSGKYFLDKTPRYHLIVEEIFQLFPEGKFIFLWRNPLSIIASMLDTWGQGQWRLYRRKVDLFTGLANLCQTYEKYCDHVGVVNYETLLINPKKELKPIFEYLALPFDAEILQNFDHVQLKGQMGDPTGVKNYKAISQTPLNKWENILNNPIRKAWCKGYLEWIGKERLALMGYNINELIYELNQIPSTPRFLLSDAFGISYGAMRCVLEPQMFKRKMQAINSWHELHEHG